MHATWCPLSLRRLRIERFFTCVSVDDVDSSSGGIGVWMLCRCFCCGVQHHPILPAAPSSLYIRRGRRSLFFECTVHDVRIPHLNSTPTKSNRFFYNVLLGVVPQRHHSSDCHRHRHSILDIRLRAAAASDIDVHPRPKPGHHPGRRDGVLAHLRALAVLCGARVSTPIPVHCCPRMIIDIHLTPWH